MWKVSNIHILLGISFPYIHDFPRVIRFIFIKGVKSKKNLTQLSLFFMVYREIYKGR